VKEDMEKPKIRIIIIAVLVVLVAACLIFWIVNSNKPTGSSMELLADALQSKDSEPTAFQPFYYTATPTREVEPITNSLMPNPGLLPPEGQVNILILGSDWRASSGYRTDVILLMSIYTKEKKVSLVSFPRDIWVEIPGLQEERINTAMGYGGFPLLAATFEHNFAIHVDHYMMTNFAGFTDIVDTLGGIEIEASKNTADQCDLSYAHGAWCSVGPGKETLDGETALWYVRSRKTSSDFDRTRRAQEVLIGLFKKLMSFDAVSQAPELYNEFSDSVETDMTLGDILEIADVATAILSDTSRIQRYAIGTSQVSPMTTTTGAYILQPDYDAVWEIIEEAVYTP
jgi:LCP family protein required for cell wall assembly